MGRVTKRVRVKRMKVRSKQGEESKEEAEAQKRLKTEDKENKGEMNKR